MHSVLPLLTPFLLESPSPRQQAAIARQRPPQIVSPSRADERGGGPPVCGEWAERGADRASTAQGRNRAAAKPPSGQLSFSHARREPLDRRPTPDSVTPLIWGALSLRQEVASR